MEMFDQLGLDLTSLLAPWIAIIISLSAVFWFKDFATNLMSGLKFKMNSAFNEGDHIFAWIKEIPGVSGGDGEVILLRRRIVSLRGDSCS